MSASDVKDALRCGMCGIDWPMMYGEAFVAWCKKTKRKHSKRHKRYSIGYEVCHQCGQSTDSISHTTTPPPSTLSLEEAYTLRRRCEFDEWLMEKGRA